jgi:hypothetical protein
MKCPLCRSDLGDGASKRLRRVFKITVVAAVVASVFFSLYSYWDASRGDMSHDVVFILPNTLMYSILQDTPEAAGGVVAVYGNISNPSLSEESWVHSAVVIEVYDGYNQTHFYIDAGLLYGGESLYFSWAYHFDRFDVSSCEVEIRAQGS